jgi:Flp pilus assembly protein TadG
MVRLPCHFARDESGAAMVEMTLVITLLLTLLLGFVDFGYAFYQWNAANKAVQVGARLAAISDTVATSTILSAAATTDVNLVGITMAPSSYSFVCTSTACTGTNSPGFDQDAFRRIFYGDDFATLTCQGTLNPGRSGMCDMFPGLLPAEVQIEYLATGLGFWTRPEGAIPTIRVSIVNHPFQFFFLGGLLNFANITMPTMLSTVTGEDLSTASP